MAEDRRSAGTSHPVRGAGFVLGLGLLILVVATAIAGVLVWAMT